MRAGSSPGPLLVKSFVIITLVVLNVGMLNGGSSIKGYFELTKSRDVLKETVGQLDQEIAQISAEIQRIRSSSEYARKVLRDKYHTTDPDEDIIFYAE